MAREGQNEGCTRVTGVFEVHANDQLLNSISEQPCLLTMLPLYHVSRGGVWVEVPDDVFGVQQAFGYGFLLGKFIRIDLFCGASQSRDPGELFYHLSDRVWHQGFGARGVAPGVRRQGCGTRGMALGVWCYGPCMHLPLVSSSPRGRC